MRTALLMVTLSLFGAVGGCRPARPSGATASLSASSRKPDFEGQIKPVFQTRCQPCHFPGGKVYDKMPFDKPETITRLGEKLFTRIKDKEEQRVIRDFLSQP